MKRALRTLSLAGALVLTSAGAPAQFVKGNDAVQIAHERRTVETPPAPPSVGRIGLATRTFQGGSWRMVETPDGLVECTKPYAREGSCRKSTCGAQMLRRVWVVKRGTVWLQCQFPDPASPCAEMAARPPANLPSDALQ